MDKLRDTLERVRDFMDSALRDTAHAENLKHYDDLIGEALKSTEISESYTYVITSDSEEGFWDNMTGWVSDIEFADQWTGAEIISEPINLPLSSGNDARFVVVNYNN